MHLSPFQFAVNSQGRNKNWNFRVLNGRFKDITGTLDDAIDHIRQGHAICAGLLRGKWRSKPNFAGSAWVLAEIDNAGVERDETGAIVKDADGNDKKIYQHQMTIEEAIVHPFIRDYCSLIYTTPSHRPDWHRFRLVFLLPELVTDIDQYEAIVRCLLEQLPHDPACKDGVRVFYGNSEAEFPLVNTSACLPPAWIEQVAVRAEQERQKRAQAENLLMLRRQQIQQRAQAENWNLDQLIEQALSYIPPRSPGSGNYPECLAVLQALHSHYGMEAEAIAERWSPSIKGNTWQIPKKLRSFKRSGIQIGTLFYIAKQYGFRFPQRSSSNHRRPRLTPDRTASKRYIRPEEDQERIAEAQAWEAFTRKLKRLHTRASDRTWKGFATLAPAPSAQLANCQTQAEPVTTSAIVLYDPTFALRRWVQWVEPNTVPAVETWKQWGRPVLVYAPEHRSAILQRMVKYGYSKILMADTTGSGKSLFAGQFLQEHQAREADRQQAAIAENNGVLPKDYTVQQATYTAGDYRNPSTESLEAIPEAVSAGGLVFDRSKQTPSGNFYRKRAVKGQTPDLPALCPEDNNIQSLRAKGMDVGRGKESAFCQNCAQFQGCPYLAEQAAQKKQPALRTHLNKFSPTPGAIVLIDEAGRAIQGTRQITATLADIEVEISRIAKFKPRFYQRVQPLLDRLFRSLRRAIEEKGYHGLVHADVVKFLPAAEEVTLLLWNAIADDWLAVDDPWCFLDAIERLRDTVQPHLKEEFLGANTPEAKSKIIDGIFTAGMLPKLLKIILGLDRTAITITRDSQIILTQRDYHSVRAIAKCATALLLDGTPDPRDLARKLGIKATDICTVQAVSASFANLTLKRVRGMGRIGQQRKTDSSQCLMPRILKVVQAIVQAAPDPKRVGLLDLKRFTEDYAQLGHDLLIGHHFADNRNSNRFRNCTTMITVPLASQNLGLLLAEWQVLTGQTFTLDQAPPAFWAAANRKTTQELLQDVGRTRAQHRLSEAITHWIVTEMSDDQWQQLQAYFPGCNAVEVDLYDFCPTAAPRSEARTARRIVQAVWEAARRGKLLTIDAVAAQLELGKSRISQVAKSVAGGFRALRQSLVWLVNALDNQTELTDLPATHQWIAEWHLPELAGDLAECGRSPVEVLKDFQLATQGMTHVQVTQMLAVTPLPTLTRLLGSFLSLLPANHLNAIQHTCWSEVAGEGTLQPFLRFNSE